MAVEEARIGAGYLEHESVGLSPDQAEALVKLRKLHACLSVIQDFRSKSDAEAVLYADTIAINHIT